MKAVLVKLRRKVMASSCRLPVCGGVKDIKAKSHLAEAGHASTSMSHSVHGVRGGFDWFGHKT
jgi:hypothetical protein